MASYYPHKQTLLIAILCILVVGGALIYAQGGISSTTDTPIDSVDTSIAVETQRIAVSTSTDWRKSFFNSTSTAPIKSSVTQKSPDTKLTLTDQFGREFFARYIQLSQSGLIDNQQFVESTLNQTIANASDIALKAPVYTTKDIVITSVVTPATIRAYANSVAGAFSTYGVDADAATIANDAFEQGDMSLLEEIRVITTSYQNIFTVLKNTPVPQPLANYHVDLLTSIAHMEFITQNILSVESDPMQTVVSLAQYTDVQASILTTLRTLKTYFALIPIAFESTEPGSLFLLTL